MRKPRTWPGLAPAGLAAACGAALALGQAPWGLWWLALPALSVLLHRLTGGAARAAWLGWVAGTAYFAAAMFWIVEPFLVDAARDGWMAPFALVFLSLGLGLFWAGAAALGAWAGGPVALALAFTAADLLRGYALTGFPWALLGHVWIDTPVAQLAAYVGPAGLSFFTLLVAAAPIRSLHRGLPVAAVLLGLAWGGGLLRLAEPDPAGQGVTVRIIQPNAAQHLKWDPDMAALFFQRQLEMSAAREGGAPDLVLWPETAVNFLLEDQLGLDIIAEAAGGVPVALGIQRREGRRFYNSLAVIDPEARVQALYDKHHLVPFGEYVPFGDLLDGFGLRGFAAREGQGYSAGPGPAVLDLGPLGRVLPLICYEAVFPQDLRAPERPDWILQATNDAWFGRLVGPYQHLAQARLRAVEQGLPLIRAANTGVSGVIDAKGRLHQSLPLDSHGFIDAEVPGALAPTPYAVLGDLPIGLLLLASFVALGFTRFRNSG
ncbi:apolipoprotein N-acyltransferase [Plastorhodobacter daqingensis]|uniref:Apolipoprotein N-acyltransferase n=1 Tax=Plastorhodobacter daqingensis TaxID=1387281 RepID=A0ABW2UI31_9RHOB